MDNETQVPVFLMFAKLEDPPPESAKDLAEKTFQKAVQNIMRNGKHASLFVFQLADRYAIVDMDHIMALPNGGDLSAEIAHDVAARLKPIGFVVILESMMGRYDREEENWERSPTPEELELAEGLFSDDKLEKTEMLIVDAQTVYGEYQIAGNIERGPGEKIISVTRNPVFEDPRVTAVGKFTGVITRGNA